MAPESTGEGLGLTGIRLFAGHMVRTVLQSSRNIHEPVRPKHLGVAENGGSAREMITPVQLFTACEVVPSLFKQFRLSE
jgi:hypothetical protein